MASISIESGLQRKGRIPFYRKPEFLEKVIDFVTPERTVDVFQSFFRYEEEQGFEQDVLHYLKKGYWPVGVFSHFVQADAFAFAKAAHRITTLSKTIEDKDKHIIGCYALHQGTMDNGSQGNNLQVYTTKFEKAMNKKGMIYLSYITEEHVQRYNLDPEEVLKINYECDRKIKSAKDDRIGLLTFPAGNMQAARFNQNGELNGMVKSDMGWITQMAKRISRGAKILFIPGVIIDSNRISSPDTRDLTEEAIKYFPRNLLADLVPYGLGSHFQAKLARLIMRRPYPIDKLSSDLIQLTNDPRLKMEDLRTLGVVMIAYKELTDQLIMGIIRDRMPESLAGNYYKGYNSFSLGDYFQKEPLV